MRAERRERERDERGERATRAKGVTSKRREIRENKREPRYEIKEFQISYILETIEETVKRRDGEERPSVGRTKQR